jgi:hypothetical protein
VGPYENIQAVCPVNNAATSSSNDGVPRELSPDREEECPHQRSSKAEVDEFVSDGEGPNSRPEMGPEEERDIEQRSSHV